MRRSITHHILLHLHELHPALSHGDARVRQVELSRLEEEDDDALAQQGGLGGQRGGELVLDGGVSPAVGGGHGGGGGRREGALDLAVVAVVGARAGHRVAVARLEEVVKSPCKNH